jgi:hypothetical protein
MLVAAQTAPQNSYRNTVERIMSVLVSMKDCLWDNMQTLKRKPSQELEVADDRLVKMLRTEKASTFKKKSHETQFQFKATIMDQMEEATAAL